MRPGTKHQVVDRYNKLIGAREELISATRQNIKENACVFGK